MARPSCADGITSPPTTVLNARYGRWRTRETAYASGDAGVEAIPKLGPNPMMCG